MQYNAYIYILNLNIHFYALIYGCIWPYIPIYSAFKHFRGAGDTFTVHSHPGSWCMLYQADIATVKRNLTATWRS